MSDLDEACNQRFKPLCRNCDDRQCMACVWREPHDECVPDCPDCTDGDDA